MFFNFLGQLSYMGKSVRIRHSRAAVTENDRCLAPKSECHDSCETYFCRVNKKGGDDD